MPFHTKAFWAMSLFLVGVCAASTLREVRGGLNIVVLLTALTALFFIITKRWIFAPLIIFVIFGAGYGSQYAQREAHDIKVVFDQKVNASGIVKKVAVAGDSQQFDVELAAPLKGLVRVRAGLYPVIAYGDEVEVSGVFKRIEGESTGYFRKEGIVASMSFPKSLAVISQGNGSTVKAALYTIRDSVQGVFKRTLSPRQATLMTGLVLGKSGGFDKEFTEKLKITGTTHLVALSGYNISVIITSLFYILGFVMHRRYAVWLCILAVIAFVVMTGAEASVVRAAIMAIIMVLAERTSRPYSVRNAIAATALVMTLLNPEMLVFDVGFQLSFLALMGIVYVEPLLARFFSVEDDAGLFGWKKSLLTTIAAQVAVLPVLLMSFGFFSPLSIITNVLLLAFIPYTMGLGFFLVLTGWILPILAFLVALPARVLLGYELMIIDLFARIPFGVEVRWFSWPLALLYYVGLAGGILYLRRRIDKKTSIIESTPA